MSVYYWDVLLLLINIHRFNCKIECINGIKRFSAYPSDVEDPSFYYDCSNTKYAVLKRCRDAAVYDSALESCRLATNPNSISRRSYRIRSTKVNKRQKRNVKNAMEKYLARKGVGEQENQPVLGRPIKLGALYYGAEERISFDENLWNDKSLKNNATRINVTSSSTKLAFLNKLKDRLNLFSIKAEVEIGMLKDKMKLGGSLEFLRSGRVSEETINVALLYESIRYQESISQEMRFLLDNAELCKKVDEANGPTHVVSSITRGMNGFFEFQKKSDNETNKDTIGGSFTLKFTDPVTTISLEGSATIKVSSDEATVLENSELLFYGDTILEKIPSTAQESLEVIHSLPKLAKKSEAILTYGLSPITRFCDETTTFLNSLNEKIYLEITEIRQEFEETKIKLDDIVARKEVKVFSQTIEKNLNAFRMKFRAFQSKWTGTMGDLVSDIKNNKKSESDLMKHLIDYKRSPFTLTKTELFLNNRHRELDALNLILEKGPKFKDLIVERSVDEDGKYNADGNRCLFENKYALIFQLYVLPSNQTLAKYLTQSEDDNYSEHDMWFWNEDMVAIAGAKHQYLFEFFNENLEDTREMKGLKPKQGEEDSEENVCVMVRVKKAKEDMTSSNVSALAIFKEGEVMVEDFWPPPKLTYPREVVVSPTKICFNMDFSNERNSFEGNMKFQITYEFNHTIEHEENRTETVTRCDIKEVEKDQETNIIIADKWNATIYKFNVSLKFEFGFSPHFISFPVHSYTCSKPTLKEIEKSINLTNLELNWEDPADCVLKEKIDVLSYKIEYYDLKDANQSNSNIIIIKSNSVTIDDLDINIDYQIRIQVVVKEIHLSSYLPRIHTENEKMEIDLRYDKDEKKWMKLDEKSEVPTNSTENESTTERFTEDQ